MSDTSTDRAVVIGCDAYPRLPGADLGGAVRDALAMRSWLLQPDGGGLSRRQVTLLASPAAGSPTIAADDLDGAASVFDLPQQVRSLIQGPPGRRLYVYIAGHGCRTDPTNPYLAQDAILLTEFSPASASVGSFALQELYLRLRTAAPFEEVVIVVDACRDVPYRERFTPGGLGFQTPVARDLRPGRVFLLQSTAPGQRAYGGSDQQLRGAFSAALIDGLSGAGCAKRFDDLDGDQRPYRVLWSSLCEYLSTTVRDQTPDYLGSGDLVLATFPEGAFSPVTLTVQVRPEPAATLEQDLLRVSATWNIAGGPQDGTVERPGPAPVRLDLPPRQHRIRANAGKLSGKQSINLYTDAALELTLSAPPTVRGGVWRGGDRPQPSSAPALVRISCEDLAAVLELRTGSGGVIARGSEDLRVAAGPGWYTAAAIGSGGREVTQTVGVEAGGGDEILRLQPRTRQGWPLLPLPFAWSSPPCWVATSGLGTPDGWQPGAAWSPDARLSGVVVVSVAEQPTADPYEQGSLGHVAGSLGQSLAAVLRSTAAGVPARSPVAIAGPPGLPAVLARVEVPTGPRHSVDVAGTRIQVPAMPGVITSVVVCDGDLHVRLYDVALLSQPRPLLWLDRAQDLLALRREDAASFLLQALDAHQARSQVAAQLRALGEQLFAAGPGTSAGTGPWQVTV